MGITPSNGSACRPCAPGKCASVDAAYPGTAWRSPALVGPGVKAELSKESTALGRGGRPEGLRERQRGWEGWLLESGPGEVVSVIMSLETRVLWRSEGCGRR